MTTDGTTHLIWAEDWPDAEPPCDECGAWPADVLTNGGENRNAPGTWHEDSCSLHTDNIIDPTNERTTR